MSNTKVPRTAWSPRELAESLGVHYETVLDAIHTGTIAAVKFGRTYRVPEEERQRLFREAIEKAEAARGAA